MFDPVQVCDVLVSTFSARQDAYTRWTGQHWSSIPEPLTGQVAYEAIARRVPVSGYTIAPGSVTHLWAFDLDIEDGWDVALRLGTAAWDVSLPAYAERSRRGAHLWGVLGEQAPARLVRRAMRHLLELAGVPPDPKIELRPAQDDLPDGGYGNSLRLPTMPHPKTHRRSALYDPRTGEPLGASLGEMMLRIEPAPLIAVETLARSYRPPLDPRFLDEQDRPPRARWRDDADSACEILRTLYNVGSGTARDPYPRAGKAVKCPAHDDQNPSLHIFPDDQRVLCHSTSCDWNNGGHGIGTYMLRKSFFARPGDPSATR